MVILTVVVVVLKYSKSQKKAKNIRTLPVFSCSTPEIADIDNGFIQSPLYPKYNKTSNCTITLHGDKDRIVKLYLLDMVLSSYEDSK